MNHSSDPFYRKKIEKIFLEIKDDIAELNKEAFFGLDITRVFFKTDAEYNAKWDLLRNSEKRDFREVLNELETIRESISALRDDLENSFEEVKNSVNLSFESSSDESEEE